MGDVNISYTIGDVSLVRGSDKRTIEAVPFKKLVKLRDGDRIITGVRSYVVDLKDEPGPTQTGTTITIFPNSELVLGIKEIITSIGLRKGLFKIDTEKEVITPTAELQFSQSSNIFLINVDKYGTVVVASVNSPITVLHKKTKRGVVIGPKQQVSVTQENILEPCEVDLRFKEAYKVYDLMVQSLTKFAYNDMLEMVPQELHKLTKVVEKKTGRKVDYDPVSYQKWLKELKEFGEWKYDEVIETELPEFRSVKAEEKITPAAKSKITDINKTIRYQGVDFKIVSAEKSPKGWNTPEGKEFLILNVEAKNNLQNQVIIFYEEEVRLINESGEAVPLEDYTIENNFEPWFETKGSLMFAVDKTNDKFKLQFGKKSLSKVELEFKISEDEL